MKKAILIGLDFYETKMATNYNTHDIRRLAKDLLQDYDITMLTDDVPENNAKYPNYENICTALENFITDEPDAKYVFVYCGNSRDKYDKVKDEDGERLPQTLKVLPSLLPRGKETEVITSKKLRELLIDRLPKTSSLTCIISSNCGHELIPTRFEYNFKRGKFNGDCELFGETDKNVLVIAFSTSEYNPVEMKLSAPDKEELHGSLGIFALIGLVMEAQSYKESIPREAWLQAILKKMVANNPSKIKTYNMLTVGSESQEARKTNFFIF